MELMEEPEEGRNPGNINQNRILMRLRRRKRKFEVIHLKQSYIDDFLMFILSKYR